MSFPEQFTWGVASASYQVEGAAADDGKGPSVWDMFCRKPGAVWHGQTGDIACDHYHRYREDVALMHELGFPAYRFSIAWPRVLPEGVGRVNPRGLDFYDRLVDALCAAGITPWVTLFHWDFPLALYQRGGWLNRESADWFAEYAGVVVERLSDRVSHWMPQNEAACFIGHGLLGGIHAPGDRLAFGQVLQAAHHSLLAHGKAVQVIRARARTPASIGTALVAEVKIPASESAEDIAAARRATFRVARRDCFQAALWADPLFLGHYPVDGLAFFGADAPVIKDGDLALIHQPLDFCGLNIYNGEYYRAGEQGEPEPVPLPPGYPKVCFNDWPVTPSVLYWGPAFYHERYHLPIVITENGAACADVISLDGQVHDPQRIDFLQRYLREFRRAGEDGIPVQGYFHWCFTDNFEWNLGDSIRVGLVFTDYPTQRRIPKDSAPLVPCVIEANGGNL